MSRAARFGVPQTGGAPCPHPLIALPDGELVAQDQDLGGLPRILAPDSRSHVITCVIRRKTSRRRMTGDHHSPAVGAATLLVTVTDGILGTHNGVMPAASCAVLGPTETSLLTCAATFRSLLILACQALNTATSRPVRPPPDPALSQWLLGFVVQQPEAGPDLGETRLADRLGPMHLLPARLVRHGPEVGEHTQQLVAVEPCQGYGGVIGLAESPRGLGGLYVALTRPTQRACVVYPVGLTSLVASLSWHDAERVARIQRSAFGRLSVGSWIRCARSGRGTGSAALDQG